MLSAPCALVPESYLLPDQRITTLATIALQQLLAQLPKSALPTRLVVQVPGSATSRGRNLEVPALRQALTNCHTAASNLTIQIVADNPEEPLLTQIYQELLHNPQQRIIFGGADSLVDDVTCMELITAKQGMTNQHDQGILPGEAAAFVCLESAQNTAGHVTLAASHSAPEPQNGKGASTQLKGLYQAMSTCLATPQSRELDSVLLPFGGSMAEAFEWYQAVEQCWPKQQKKFSEELRPRQFIGDIGAATLPLYLVLGLERLKFNFDPREQLLVCSATPETWRTALLLRKL